MAYYVSLSVSSDHFVSVGSVDSQVDAEARHCVARGHRLSSQQVALFPTQAMVPDKVKEIVRDFLLVDSCWIVSKPFRDIAEELEPGVHQFMPIELVNRDGEPFSKQFHQMHVLNRVDAVDPDHSDIYWGSPRLPDGTELEPIMRIRTSDPKFTLDRSKTAGLHIWKGDRQLPLATFFSDPLMDAVRDAKLRGLRAVRAEEV